AAKIALDALSYPREGLREVEDAFVLRRFADLAEAVVIAVLLATLGVTTSRLQMAARIGRDPYVRPGRRDGKTADAADIVRILYGRSLGRQVAEAAAGTLASDARPIGGRIPQARVLRGLDHPRLGDGHYP